MTTYAATKAGVAHLAEGLRVELAGTPIKVTVLHPGYIASEMNDRRPHPAHGRHREGRAGDGRAIEKEKASACVPALPWAPMSLVMRYAPLPIYRRLI